MSKPFQHWTVLPHEPITSLGDDLWVVNGTLRMPLGETHRRMTVVRLADHRLVVFSAIALDEAEMTSLEALGTPAYLVVPSDIHRMDAKVWKMRYPLIQVIAPAGAREKVDEVAHVDGTSVDFHDPTVRFVTVPGTDDRDSALVVERNGRTTLVLTDLVFNEPNKPGFTGWIAKALGLTGDEPHLPGVVRIARVKDPRALQIQLEAWSRMPSLSRIVVAHGAVIEREPGRVLHEIASQLAA